MYIYPLQICEDVWKQYCRCTWGSTVGWDVGLSWEGVFEQHFTSIIGRE